MNKHLFCTVLLILTFIINSSYANMADDLVAYYPFSGNANDESGNGNHGTVSGAQLTKDRFDNDNSAYYFDGVDDSIIFSGMINTDIFTKNDFTIAFYFNLPPTAEFLSFISKRDACVAGKFFDLRGYSDGSIGIETYGGLEICENEPCGLSFGNSTSDTWHFLAVTRQSCTITTYFDGVLVGTLTTSEIFDFSNNSSFGISNSPCIGKLYIPTGITTKSFHGVIDELQVYKRALSFMEITSIYKPNCEIIDSDNDGVIDQWDQCSNTPTDSIIDKTGCQVHGLYTEEQMNQMVKKLLLWGDTNNDNRIGLNEAINALRVTSGVIEPAIQNK